jgi:hypothetical protein
MAPPQRASADRRNSEKAGAAASAFRLSRATLTVPCTGTRMTEGYNVRLDDWQDDPGPQTSSYALKHKRGMAYDFEHPALALAAHFD